MEVIEGNDDSLIMYAVMYPLLFQWTARGNFSGNFFITVFALLPFVFRKYLFRRKGGRRFGAAMGQQTGTRRKL